MVVVSDVCRGEVGAIAPTPPIAIVSSGRGVSSVAILVRGVDVTSHGASLVRVIVVNGYVGRLIDAAMVTAVGHSKGGGTRSVGVRTTPNVGRVSV